MNKDNEWFRFLAKNKSLKPFLQTKLIKNKYFSPGGQMTSGRQRRTLKNGKQGIWGNSTNRRGNGRTR